MIIKDQIDVLDTMYPCYAEKIDKTSYSGRPYSTLYGYISNGEVIFPNGSVGVSGQYFCHWTGEGNTLNVTGECFIFTRVGYKGQNMIGGPLEDSGRLVYIDQCSDSLLVYPPRMGDPSLNMLYFPPNIAQSFHIHPSIRLGIIVGGSGYACLNKDGKETQIPLKVGTMFCIEEREKHRFVTVDDDMTVIAFHPDGDWGPTDHNHTMLNRTYLTK